MAWMVYDYPEPPVEQEHITHCPVCGEECDFFYTQDGEIIGCSECVDKVSFDEI